MKVVRPSENPITQGYSNNHRAYDRAGLNLPDEVRAGMDGVIVEQVDQYNTNWINTGTLTIKDYGNYIKIRHDDGSFELHAHLKQGSSLNIGTRVKAAQVVARIGNTGNSTGFHLHSEYRNTQNINMEVEFIDIIISPQPMDPIIQRKASWYDRIIVAREGSQNTNIRTDAQDQAFTDRMIRERDRGGNWDKLGIKAGLSGDSNAWTVDQVYKKIEGGDVAALKKKLEQIKTIVNS